MTVRRTVPNIETDRPEQSREFYVEFLGFDIAMQKEEIITFASPSNPTAQISVLWPRPLFRFFTERQERNCFRHQ